VPAPWQQRDGNLPWDDPAFSERMLREHLDESHGAASRVRVERTMQLEWLWPRLGLQPNSHVFDVTCGPGLYAVELAGRGCRVTGLDFSPAAIDYARHLARAEGVSAQCRFGQGDVRHMESQYDGAGFDAALLLYGQLAVFPRAEAETLLARLAGALKPGGRLAVELLNPDRVDKTHNTWWFTDDTGLWGDMPFLHLGERFWLAEEETSVERYHILHLDSGQMDEITLCDQTYRAETMVDMLKQAGFGAVEVFLAWDNLPLYDAGEWVVYLAER
jgi:SAM-dependent methyltransferase